MNTNHLNNISSILLMIIGIAIGLYITIVKLENEPRIYNYIDLKIRYKNYIVADKEETKSHYILYLVNPTTNKKDKVYVTENIYYNIYFVSDSIK